MDKAEFIVRGAIIDDAPVIAQVVAMGIGDEDTLREYCGDDYLSVLEDIVRTEGTQYSYCNALVAINNEVVVGAAVGYDGKKLQQLRNQTYAVIHNRLGRIPTIADETQAGEYYIDSIAVLPQHRGNGVGKALINAMCDKAVSEGHTCMGLIVDCDNPRAESLYNSLGFERVGERCFFGHQMWHLQKRNDSYKR